MNQSTNHSARTFVITHRTLYFALLIGISIVSGILLFLVPPILLFGAILILLLCFFILARPYLGLLIYFAIFVMRPGILFPPLAVLHVERIFGVLVLLSMLLNMKFRKSGLSFVHNRINYILIAFLVIMGLSVPTSFWPTQSVNAIIDFGKTLIFYFLITNLLTDQKRLRIFVWEYILLTGWVALSSLHGYFTGNIIFDQEVQRAYGVSGTDSNTLAASLDLAIPFMYFMLYTEKSKWLRVLTLFVLAAAIITIILTGSRSGFLGLTAIVFLVWLKSKQKALGLVILLLVGSTTWLLMPEQHRGRYKTILTSTTEVDASSQERIDAWKAGMKMFYDKPILGVGVGTFSTAHATGYTPEGKRRSWLKAHSLYVQVLAELGILGTIVFSMLIYAIIKQNIRLKRLILDKLKIKDWNYYLSMAMMTSLGCLFVTGIFGHSLFRFNWYFIAALTVVLVKLTSKEINLVNN